MTDEELAAIRKRHAAASPGPYNPLLPWWRDVAALLAEVERLREFRDALLRGDMTHLHGCNCIADAESWLLNRGLLAERVTRP